VKNKKVVANGVSNSSNICAVVGKLLNYLGIAGIIKKGIGGWGKRKKRK